MKGKLILVVLFITSLVITFYGCVPSKPVEDVEILPSERLVKRLEANRRKIKAFEGSGVITINTATLNNVNASFRIIVQKPDSIYLEIYGPFGIDLAKAMVTQGKFTFYDIINNTIYRGSNNSDILEKIFKVKLSFNELIDAFTGSVNMTKELTEQPSQYEVSYDKYILTYVDSNTQVKSRYKVDIRDLTITDYQIFDDVDDEVLSGVYANFKVVENVSIPMFVQITNKEDDQKVTIEYRKVNLNKKNKGITFNFPDDAKFVDW